MTAIASSFTRFLGYYLFSKGKAATLHKVAAYLSPGRLAADYRLLKGIADGRMAFQGPRSVQVDLTDDCNAGCIGCWCNSPLLSNPARHGGRRLEYGRLEEIIGQLKKAGTGEITLSGGGEPTLHPRFLDIVRLVKRMKMRCVVYTNLAAVEYETLEGCAEAGLDMLAASVWAADSAVYERVHPGAGPAVFDSVREKLIFLSSIKKRNGPPVIRINNVINRLNYLQIPAMARFARGAGADEVVFTVTDAIPGATDSLLLSPAELAEAVRLVNSLDHEVSIAGREDFLRRCSSPGASRGEYEGEEVQERPCYTGWLFCRILADGRLVPCLKAHRFAVGSIYESDFSELWNSAAFQEFREMTKGRKRDGALNAIGNGSGDACGCRRVCDDASRNLFMQRRLYFFPTFRFLRCLLSAGRRLRRIPLSVARLGGIVFLFCATASYGLFLKLLRLRGRISIFPGE